MKNYLKAYLIGFNAGKSVRARFPRRPPSMDAHTDPPQAPVPCLPLFPPSAPPCAPGSSAGVVCSPVAPGLAGVNGQHSPGRDGYVHGAPAFMAHSPARRSPCSRPVSPTPAACDMLGSGSPDYTPGDPASACPGQLSATPDYARRSRARRSFSPSPATGDAVGSASPDYTPGVPSSGHHGQAREPLSPARRPVASPSLAQLPGAGKMLDPSSPDYTPGAPDSPLQGSPAYTPMSAAWLPSPRRSTTPPSANSTHLASSPYASSDAGLSSPHVPSSDGELQRSTSMEGTPACTPLKTAWESPSRPSPSPPAIQRLVRPSSDVYREETPEIFSDDDEHGCSATRNRVDPVEAEWRKTKRPKVARQDKKGAWGEHACIDISDEED